jgi:coenzyme F420-reducing hydrogenase gamma subunit
MAGQNRETARKPRLAVFKFASCDGCQLSLLDLEEWLLELGGAVEIAYFREATSLASEGPFDLTLIDGSITTAADAERIKSIRARSGRLVALGACATAGGIQALRNFVDVRDLCRIVYARPEYISTLATSTAISEHVPVDFELRGCPPNRLQLLEVVSAFLNARAPAVAAHSVCLECKLRGNVCVMVVDQPREPSEGSRPLPRGTPLGEAQLRPRGTPCLGPVTHAGCGAICPAYHRGCYGCFGPMEAPNTGSMAAAFAAAGRSREDLLRVFRTFTGNAPAFRAEAARHEGEAP